MPCATRWICQMGCPGSKLWPPRFVVEDFAIRLDGMERPMATDVLQVLGVACNLLDFASLYLDQFEALHVQKRERLSKNILWSKYGTWQVDNAEVASASWGNCRHAECWVACLSFSEIRRKIRFDFSQLAGARGWDMATPQHFHHGEKELWGACGVGPDTGWTGQQRKIVGEQKGLATRKFLVMQRYASMAGFLCGSSVTTDCSCCPCDMSLGIDLDGPKSEMKSWIRFLMVQKECCPCCVCTNHQALPRRERTSAVWLIWRYGLPDWDLAVKAVQESHTRRVWRRCWAIIYRSHLKIGFSRFWHFSCLNSEYCTHPHMQRGVATCFRYTSGTTSWDWNLRRTLQQGIWRSCIAWASQCFVWSSVVTGLEIDGSWSYSRTLVRNCDVFLVLHSSARFCHSALGHIVMFLAFSSVRLKHSWLFETGSVGILRGIDAALYMESELMSSILNRFPWDVVYQDSRTTGFALNVLGSVFWREASKTSNKM